MPDERWPIVDRLFDAALERAPQERAAFLDDACADDEALRRDVESLLAHASGAGDFLAGPALELVESAPAEESLPSLVGRRLGPYRILGLLGIGGMGEVYRAHDSTLGRDVAIKILPRLFTAPRERRERFDREARLLASLNHPHIGAIYGVENMDGTPALILELVDGDTLADRVRTGPVAIDEALHIARQIADALEAAHERGIVHRDLKPANIKITPEGIAKVLDFGLAKAASGDACIAAQTPSPNETIGDTRDGVILGTTAYMSPEQARGKRVDRRSDIWAFGCVLYEMLTGQRAFAGDTISDTITRILEREPDWGALPTAPAPGVTRMLQRCLAKDPKRRLHDIADARIEIEDALSAATVTSELPAVVDRGSGPLPWAIAVITSVVLLVAVGALSWYVATGRLAQAPSRVSRMTIASSGAAAISPNGARSLTITPDGSRVVYVGNNGRQLFVRPLDRLEPTSITTGTAPLNWVFVSADGQWVGFDEGGTLRKVALTGGPALTILNTGLGTSSGATWTPDDTIIFATPDPTTGLQRVSAFGGEATVLTRPSPAQGELDHLWPEMLPSGRALLYTIVATTGGPDAAQIALLDLPTGTHKVLLRGGSHAHYIPTGHLVYTAGGTLRAIPFDLARLETQGTAVTVLQRLAAKPQGAGEFVVAADGTLAYVDAADFAAAVTTLVWVDRQGREEVLAAPSRSYMHPRLSPDGMRLAVAAGGQGSGNIWVWDFARTTLSQVTFDSQVDHSPAWTPDGQRLLFFSPSRDAGLFWQRADGIGAAERLGTGLPSAVTPDGKHAIFHVGVENDLMMLALDGTRHVASLVKTPANERNGVVSPDGRWLAYESDRSGRFEIYVKPFPNVNAGLWNVSTAGGTRPLWAPKIGRELFYVAPDGALMGVAVDPRRPTWSARSPAKILAGPYATAGPRSTRTYDVSSDGQRFLMVKQAPATQTPAPQIVVVQNWFEELKARMAVP